VYLGVKGGATELLGGVTGIFTKPYQKAKEEGAKGFVKGIGSGLVGAIASPFAATLRLGNTVSSGIKNSALKIGKGKIPQYGRFRHPRYFNSRSILQPYDEAFSEAYQVLKTIEEGKYLGLNIRFFADFERQAGSKKVGGLLIITESYFLYVEELKHLRFNCHIANILKKDVYEEGRGSMYHMYLVNAEN